MIKTVKFCIDQSALSPAQVESFARHAGVARKAWNWALAEHNVYNDRVREIVRASGADMSIEAERSKAYEDAKRQALEETPAAHYNVGMIPTTTRFRAMTAASGPDDDWGFWCHENHGVFKKSVNYVFEDLAKSISKYYEQRKNFTPKKPRKDGRPDGWPRFKSLKTTPPAFAVTSGKETRLVVSKHRLRLPGTLGIVRVYNDTRRLRKLIAAGGTTTNKTMRFTRQGGRWYVSIIVAMPDTEPTAPTRRMRERGAVGIDQGLVKRLALSDGSFVENPRYGKANARRVRKLNKALARRREMGVSDSAGYARTKEKLGVAHRRAAQSREGFLHQVTKELATGWETIGIEDLRVVNMTAGGGAHKKGLNRALADASFGILRSQLEYKSTVYGSRVVAVPPQYTSQTCSSCGHTDKESRETQARFSCTRCGYTANADTNAAVNIRRLACNGGTTQSAEEPVPLGVESASPLRGTYQARKGLAPQGVEK